MKKWIVLAACGLLWGITYAKVKPVAHYNFGKSGNVSFAVAPESVDLTKNMKLPLYYTGLKGKATIIGEDGSKKAYQLNEKEELTLPVSIKAGATTWFLIEE